MLEKSAVTETPRNVAGTAAATAAGGITPGSKAGESKSRNMTSAEKAEWDAATEVPAFNVASLSPAERKQAQDIAAACTALIIKGLLNRHDPKTYPVPTDASSPEAEAAKAVAELPSKMFETIRPQLVMLAQTGRGFAKVSPAVQKIDFKQPSIAGALKGLAPSVDLNEHKPLPAHHIAPASPSKYRVLQLNLRSLRCDHETYGGWPHLGSDEILLGGVLIGASGHINPVPATYCGQFDTPSDGENDYYVTFGNWPWGQYTLASTPGWPKDFFCIFQLVETDHDIQDGVASLTHAIHTILNNKVIGAATGGLSVVGGAIIQALGDLIGSFISDTHFPPYGVLLRLQDENGLGSDGKSNLHKTGHIRTDQGDYVIGYQWLLAA